MEIETQNEHIYQWLLDGKSITSLDAMLHHHIGRLASRVCDLTQVYAIPISREREPNSDGKGFHTRYYMRPEYRNLLRKVSLREAFQVLQSNKQLITK